MTPKLTLLDNSTLVVSPSQLDKIKTCPRQWQFNHLYRRVKTSNSAALVGGGAFDSALNHRYTKCGSAAPTPDVVSEMNALVDAGFAGVELGLEEYRTPSLYKDALAAYNEQWQAEPFETLGMQVPIAVELGDVLVPSGFWASQGRNGPNHLRVVLQGLLDRLIKWNNEILVCDTKTSNDWGPTKHAQWEHAAQPKAYAMGMQLLAAANPGLGLPAKVHGFMLDAVVIRKPYNNPNRKPSSKDLPRFEFHRPRFYYTQEVLDEWRADTLSWIETALGWVAKDHFPRNELYCGNHYGKVCPWLDCCATQKAQRESVLASDLYRDYDRGPLSLITTTK